MSHYQQNTKVTRTELLKKYNVPVPRYTSYPTVPYWQVEDFHIKDWKKSVVQAFEKDNAISLYVHLPYCESLCTYCGCNTRITKNHIVEMPYVEALLKEWEMYLSLFPSKPTIKELHFGGGTPTFFQPKNLEKLLQGLFRQAYLTDDFEFGFEAHPSSTSKQHLQSLYNLGFRRISIGIQDFDPMILKAINRKQSFEQVKRVTEDARAMGYTSVNYDIIFGLPFQKLENIEMSMGHIKTLKPDRIAFYSYAHVPWIKPGQRAYSEKDLPSDEKKRSLYELGKDLLEENGYYEIGMDHFALKNDELYQAMEKGTLHRNFMGYTPLHTELMIGLGASSISDSWTAFAQNEKKVEDYMAQIEKGNFPVFRGHLLNEEDLILRKHILNLMCHFQTDWSDPKDQCDALYAGLERMDESLADGLVEKEPFRLKITPQGRTFIRNICMALDARLWSNQPTTRLFSQGV